MEVAIGLGDASLGETRAIEILNDRFCDAQHASDVEAFLSPRAPTLSGGPRALANILESLRLSIVMRKRQEPSAREFFSSLDS